MINIPDPDSFAFPLPALVNLNGDVHFGNSGMTMREYYAGQALAGEMANSSDEAWSNEKLHVMADRCVKAADALIAKLKETGGGDE